MSDLINSLKSNTHLLQLDVHVTELGHIGITSEGIETLVTFLESEDGKECNLCALDVSGDDGAPEVSQGLQDRLTSCLTTRALKTGKRNLIQLAAAPVYQKHNDDDEM